MAYSGKRKEYTNPDSNRKHVYNERICDCCNVCITGSISDFRGGGIPTPQQVHISFHFYGGPELNVPTKQTEVHLCAACFNNNKAAVAVSLDMLKGSR